MITPDVISAHNLTHEEYQRINELLGREPTLVELGIFSVMGREIGEMISGIYFADGLRVTS